MKNYVQAASITMTSGASQQLASILNTDDKFHPFSTVSLLREN